MALYDLLCLLNSKLLNFIYKIKNPQTGKTFAEIKPSVIKQLPIPKSIIDGDHKLLTNKAIEITSLNKLIYNLKSSFVQFFSSNQKIQKLSKKLQNWHELDFGDFIKELNKAIKAENRGRKKEAAANVSSSAVENESASRTKNSLDCARLDNENKVRSSAVEIPTLTKKDEFEWMELFEEKKKEVQELQLQINQTEKEIDQMVYELYGLSDEEIAIVEGS